MSIYKFTVFYEGCEPEYRYVGAFNEDDAFRRIERFIEDLKSRGFAEMKIIGNPTVEINHVIF